MLKSASTGIVYEPYQRHSGKECVTLPPAENAKPAR
jgi:hypothetical protein